MTEDMDHWIEETTMGIFVLQCATDPETDDEVNIVLEGKVMLDVACAKVCQAVALLFGLIYSINLTYPKYLKYFWEVLQKLVLKLEDGRNLSPKVQGLKDKLKSSH